jgi:ABC-type branched-subunit amino acid transport system permease subunit
LELTAGLTPDTEYYWVIQKNNRIYQAKATTDGTGKLVIDCSTLPAGLLNAYAGFFTLEIRSGSDYLSIVNLTINTVAYTCILMSFVEVEGEAGINNVLNSVAA